MSKEGKSLRKLYGSTASSGQYNTPFVSNTDLTFFSSHPKEFKCSITARTPKTEALIRSVDLEHPISDSDAEVLREVVKEVKAWISMYRIFFLDYQDTM